MQNQAPPLPTMNELQNEIFRDVQDKMEALTQKFEAGQIEGADYLKWQLRLIGAMEDRLINVWVDSERVK